MLLQCYPPPPPGLFVPAKHRLAQRWSSFRSQSFLSVYFLDLDCGSLARRQPNAAGAPARVPAKSRNHRGYSPPSAAHQNRFDRSHGVVSVLDFRMRDRDPYAHARFLGLFNQLWSAKIAYAVPTKKLQDPFDALRPEFIHVTKDNRLATVCREERCSRSSLRGRGLILLNRGRGFSDHI